MSRAISKHLGTTCRCHIRSGRRLLLGAACAALLVGPASRASASALTEFDHDPVVSADELAQLRGGFVMPNGLLVRFGFEIQQIANDVVQNAVSVGPVTLANGVVQQNFTVTQTTPGGTQTMQLTQIPSGGFKFPTALNNGLTNLSVTINNQSVQSVIQNQANNQALRTVTTVNLSTQGLLSALQSTMRTAQILNSIHNNNWIGR